MCWQVSSLFFEISVCEGDGPAGRGEDCDISTEIVSLQVCDISTEIVRLLSRTGGAGYLLYKLQPIQQQS